MKPTLPSKVGHDPTVLLTYEEVAKMGNVSVRTVKRYVAQKTLRVVSFGHKTKRFRYADMMELFAKLAGDGRRGM